MLRQTDPALISKEAPERGFSLSGMPVCDAGLTLDSMDKPILEVVFDLLQDHYPER